MGKSSGSRKALGLGLDEWGTGRSLVVTALICRPVDWECSVALASGPVWSRSEEPAGSAQFRAEFSRQSWFEAVVRTIVIVVEVVPRSIMMPSIFFAMDDETKRDHASVKVSTDVVNSDSVNYDFLGLDYNDLIRCSGESNPPSNPTFLLHLLFFPLSHSSITNNNNQNETLFCFCFAIRSFRATFVLAWIELSVVFLWQQCVITNLSVIVLSLSTADARLFSFFGRWDKCAGLGSPDVRPYSRVPRPHHRSF